MFFIVWGVRETLATPQTYDGGIHMHMDKEVLRSNYCNRDYEYHLLGSVNEANGKVNLLYVQDGGDYLELGEIEKVYNSLIRMYKEQGENLICVLVSPGDSIERWHSYDRRGANFNNYISFFNEELVPFVEEKLNLQVGKRGLLGDSLGANISLNIAMQKPENWSHLLLQSSAISPRELSDLEGFSTLPWHVYQTVGIYEDEFISPISNEKLYIYSRNQKMYQIFKGKNTDIEYKVQEENHLWDFWRRDLPTALQYFLNNG